MKRAASAIVRLLMFALAGWLLYRVFAGSDIDLAATLSSSRRPMLLVAFAFYGVAQLAGAWRWELLLGAHGLRLGFLNALRLTLTGNFFSLALPGAVTGDVVKITCATRLHPGHLADFAMVEMLDRIIGLCGLLLAVAITSAIAVIHPAIAGEMPIIFLKALVIPCALIPLGLFLVFNIQRLLRRNPAMVTSTRRLLAHLPRAVATKLRELNAAMSQQENHRRALLKVLAISVGIHLFLLAGTNAALGSAIGESALSLPQYCLATQLSNATGIFSITPGGIGLRDLAAADTYRELGANPTGAAAVIPLLNSLVIILWGIAGALWHILHRRQETPPPLSDTANP